MTAEIIDGKTVSASIRSQLSQEIAAIKAKSPSFAPQLVVVQVGARPDSSVYVRMKRKAAEEVGIIFQHIDLPESIDQDALLARIDSLNQDSAVHGIIVQLPLPDHLDPQAITNAVSPEKDVDGFTSYNIGELSKKNGAPHFLPCTPKGIVDLLKHSGIEVAGKHAVVLGRSDIVGVPVSVLLRNLDASVTTLHSKSTNIEQHLQNADIVVSAIGKPNFVKAEWLNSKAIVIDVGTNYIEDSTRKSGSRLVGDVEYDAAKEKVAKITPVPGGVGPMTVAELLYNVVESAKKFSSKKNGFTPLKLNLLTPVPSDYEISRAQTPKQITKVASESSIPAEDLEPYGSTKAKVKLSVLEKFKNRENGKYILVTGITPTPLGEGKSTTTVGLAQALGAHLNRLVFANVRQPSMGPTFGIKGGAAGGGYSQVIPMDEFNMHLTGDIHAISMANNLLAAAIDTRMFHESTQKDGPLYRRLVPVKNGARKFSPSMFIRLKKLGIDKTNPDDLTPEEITKFARLDIDPQSITWKRVVDCNDRFLRGITIGEAPTEKGMTRSTGFEISVASECMAILALSTSLKDMRDRLGRIVVATSKSGEPVTCDDIGAGGALTALLKDAIKPTLMQTLEGTPVMIHAGPFANISIGANSIIADKISLKLAGTESASEDSGYVVTEAGFDFTMGGERFLNIKTRNSGLVPDLVIVVATVRALKVHGGGAEVKAGVPLAKEYVTENVEMLAKGCANLQKHIQNARSFGLNVLVAINAMKNDTPAEHEVIKKYSQEAGAIDAVISDHWANGGLGAVKLAEKVVEITNDVSLPPSKDTFKFTYELSDPIDVKIRKIAQNLYGAADVEFLPAAQEKLELYAKQGFDNLPICIAKTQYSLSHDAAQKGVPKGFIFPIRDIKASIGAGYLYALAAEIQTIPGLPTHCGFMDVEVNDDGEIEGLF
ncbi:hypothetical protein DASC09_014710 [Saccharomycopsis crataegensis]|uniref:Methenyltetrahydrofolate cyclohydrolase n=1 Tax=Saccharomycopsis crataegensis TaxID=43959 RepID=A0AAV5QHI4_9ASCO|nr:hypothetical protein DASC09_014710 [Saccharomycopsis crataegensis]